MDNFQKAVMIMLGVLFGLMLYIVFALNNYSPVIVNNYISSGNYSFDIGQNFKSIMELQYGMR